MMDGYCKFCRCSPDPHTPNCESEASALNCAWMSDEDKARIRTKLNRMIGPSIYYVSEEAFNEVVRILTSAGVPSEGAKRGAELLRKLYGDKPGREALSLHQSLERIGART